MEMTDRERRRHGPPEEPKLDTSAGGFLGKYVMLIILVIIERVFWGLKNSGLTGSVFETLLSLSSLLLSV